MNEWWVPVFGFGGYEVSTMGRVRRIAAGRGARVGLILKTIIGTTGYPQLNLHVVGQGRVGRVFPKVHRIVMLSFYGPPLPGLVVNHKDGDKTNNRLDNLEYVTRSANSKHASLRGMLTTARGCSHRNAKLTPNQVRGIRSSSHSNADLGAIFGVHASAISRIRSGAAYADVDDRGKDAAAVGG